MLKEILNKNGKRRRTRNIITAGIIVGISLLAVVLILIKTNYSNPSEEIVECIANKSVLYVQEGCSHCKRQLEIFGECYNLLNVVDCTKTPNECIKVGLRAVPTWIINGTLIEGAYKIEELQNMTGC